MVKNPTMSQAYSLRYPSSRLCYVVMIWGRKGSCLVLGQIVEILSDMTARVLSVIALSYQVDRAGRIAARNTDRIGVHLRGYLVSLFMFVFEFVAAVAA